MSLPKVIITARGWEGSWLFWTGTGWAGSVDAAKDFPTEAEATEEFSRHPREMLGASIVDVGRLLAEDKARCAYLGRPGVEAVAALKARVAELEKVLRAVIAAWVDDIHESGCWQPSHEEREELVEARRVLGEAAT